MDDPVTRAPSSVGDDLLTITRLEGSVLRLTGEVDVSTLASLESALDSAVREGDDVHLELGGLSFIDVGGTRALIRFAERLGQRRRLILHEPPRTLGRIITLLWGYPDNVAVAGPGER